MRFLAKRGIWTQAAAAAVMLPVLTTAMALALGWAFAWWTLRSVEDIEPYHVVGATFTGVFGGYCIAVPCLTWLLMLPRRRLVPGAISFLAVPVYLGLVSALYLDELILDIVNFVFAGILVGTAATMGIVRVLRGAEDAAEPSQHEPETVLSSEHTE